MPTKTIVKFELLADFDDKPAEVVVEFEGCDQLGAVNLRGTGFAAEDFVAQPLAARIGGVVYEVQVNVAGIAGFLLAKSAAAHGGGCRRTGTTSPSSSSTTTMVGQRQRRLG